MALIIFGGGGRGLRWGLRECRRSGARRVYRHIGWGEAAGIEDAEKQCAVAGDGSKYRNCKFNLHFLIKFP